MTRNSLDDVLFDLENDVFYFNSSTISNVNLGVSFSETLVGDVGGTGSSMGLFSETDVAGCNVMINGGEKEDFYQEKFNGLADGGMLGVVDGGGYDGKVGNFACGLVQNENEKSVIQCSDGGCADLIFGLNDGVQMEQECEDMAKIRECEDVAKTAKAAEVSLDMEDLFSRKAFLSDAQVNVIQNYIQYNCNSGLDLVVDLNSYKNDNVSRDSVFSDANYRVSDLVWGKVRGHPWWPGQIYDPSIASEMAKRYWKKNCYLVAYFGGQKFAWNEVSKIKPFHKHFSEMAKQTDCEIFRFAVDCSVEEASRRVALGLSCPCVPEEVSSNLKTQVVANAEIPNQSSSKNGGDRLTSAASFEPAKLVNFVQSLAQSPLTEFDGLDLVNARGQVSAFYRSKGYPQLPEFAVHYGLFAEDKETLPVREEEQCNDQVLNTDQWFLQNSKYISQNINQTINNEKLLSEMMSENNSWTPNVECTLEKEAGDNTTTRRGRKWKACHDTYDYFHTFQIEDDKSTSRDYNTSDDCSQDFQIDVKNSTSRRGRKQKLACNSSDYCFQDFQIDVKKSTSRRGRKRKLVRNTTDNCFNNSQTGNSTQLNVSVHDDMWSQLCLAAKDPAGQRYFSDMIHYFADFRKFTGRNNSAFLEQGFSLQQKFDGESEAITSIEAAVITSIEAPTTASGSTPMELGVITDIEAPTTASVSAPIEPNEETGLNKQNEREEITVSMSAPMEHVSTSEEETPLNKQNLSAAEISFSTGIMHQSRDENLVLEHVSTSEEETMLNKQNLSASEISYGTVLMHQRRDENLAPEHVRESSPTAFILKFTNLDSVPSATGLNKILSRYGPLIESKTELLERTKCARVVFKRRVDAESAFSSAGKYRIFGPSLKSYRLKILPPPPMPKKDTGKRGRKSKKEKISM